MSDQTPISFDVEKYTSLVKTTQFNRERGNDTFVFEGHDMVTRYAEYLVEYLAGQSPVFADVRRKHTGGG
jgi:L-fucose isomerase-like protein